MKGPTTHKRPDVSIEAAELLLDAQKGSGIVYSGADFETITNDAWILNQSFDLLFAETSDLDRIEVGEGLSISFSLVEHRGPTQTSLCTLQNEKLKLFVVIVNRNSPLPVVVLDVQLVSALGPSTAFFSTQFSNHDPCPAPITTLSNS